MDTKPTAAMQEEAQRYRAWKAEGRDGGTDVAATRASQIIKGDPLSADTVRTMSAWFARHEVDKRGQGYHPGEEGYPSPGRVAWAAWGGDPGKTWADALVRQMDAADSRELSADLNATQSLLYSAFEDVVDEVGAFDQSSGASGAHYMPNSPFNGLQCANCAFYAGARACEIVSGDIAPEGVCKFWIIPQRLIDESPSTGDGRPFPQEHAARLRDPSAYDSFRRRNNAAGKGVDFIFGIKTGESGADLQAIRFRLSSFTAAEAKQWLKDHNYTPLQFEEATDSRSAVPDTSGACVRSAVTTFTRSASTDTYIFPFSSEYAVNRYYGDEVLSHDRGAADLSRLVEGGPVLYNHNPDMLLGVVERVWIDDTTKRGYAEIRFDDCPVALEKRRQVDNKILRGVSFGYTIASAEPTSTGIRATRWSAYEISLVSIPADPTVGFGRSLIDEGPASSTPMHPMTEPSASVPLTIEGEPPVSGDTSPESLPSSTAETMTLPNQEAVRSAERQRISSITALCARHGMADMATELIDGDRTLDEARAAVLEKLGTRASAAPIQPMDATANDLGLTDNEVKRFSVVRALHFLANQHDAGARRAASYEISVGEAAAKKYERSTNGIVVPNEVLRRDLLAGIPSAGGNLVADNLLAGSFIDLLRNRLALANAGVTVLSGLQGNISIPRHSSAATAYWVGENVAPTESQQAIDQVNMTPKTIGAFTDYSRRLLLQQSIDVETMVRNDLVRVLALEIDRVGLYGTGSSNQPLGLVNTTGIGSQTITSYGTFEEYIGMETDVATANADAGSMRYIVNAAARGALKSTAKSASAVAAGFVFENNEINGYPAIVSNQLQSNDCFFGDFSMLIMGMWSGLDLNVDLSAGATAGTVRVIALQDIDLAVKQPGAFCYGT